MNDVTKDLLEAMRALVDSHWLEDSHAVDFDGTVLFSPSYDFSNLHCHRRSELRMDGFECVVWPGGYPDFKWSAYSTYEGSLWFEQFDSEAEARAVCMKLLADVMPEHSVSKAMDAIARAEAALAEPQPDAEEACTSPATRRQSIDALVGDRLTAKKADHICERDGYAVTGVVLTLPDGRACIVNRSAVRWLHGDDDLFNLMHTDTAMNQRLFDDAVQTEREACLRCYSPGDTADDWADKIRSRGSDKMNEKDTAE